MKNILFFIIITLSILFSSCKKDSSSSSNCDELNGIWVLDYLVYDGNDCELACITDTPSTCEYISDFGNCPSLTISDDNWTITDGNGWSSSGTWDGNCSVGSSISIVWDGDVINGVISQLSSNRLVLEETYEEDESEVVIGFWHFSPASGVLPATF